MTIIILILFLGVCILNNELIRALGMLYDMEMNNYYIARSVEKLDEEIQKLGVRKNITARQSNYSVSEETFGCLTLVSLFISVIIAIVIGNIADSFWIGLLSWFVSFLVILFLCFF